MCHPRNVPTNIQNMAHSVGEFPIHFLGSHDYFWINRSRVFLFQEGDKGSKDNSIKGLSKSFRQGLFGISMPFRMYRNCCNDCVSTAVMTAYSVHFSCCRGDGCVSAVSEDEG